MKHRFILLSLGVALGLGAAVAGCSRTAALEIPKGSDVTVQKRDGVQVTGRLVEVEPTRVVVEARDGSKIQVARADIESVKAAPAAVATVPVEGKKAAEAAAEKAAEPAAPEPSAPVATTPSNPPATPLEPKPTYREVTVPAGTVLPVELTTAVGSDTSRVEDQVRGSVRRAITIDGVEVIPAGATVLGHVTATTRPAKVKGRGSIAFRFSQIDLPGEGNRHDISTGTISRLAPATKKQDAAKIGGGAVGGAIIGGILGGGDGAAKGAAIGGGAGTAVVLSTRGKDVRVGAGAPLSVKLTAPLTVRVAVK